MLTVEGLGVSYGPTKAVGNVSFSLGKGEVLCLLGANGAGKSTVLKAISGVLPAVEGKILFEGRDITRIHPSERVKLGICQVPEGRQIFASLLVVENLEMGAYSARHQGGREIARRMESVYQIFPILKERKQQGAAKLSGGEQQMLAIGRALMSQPKLLLLDEPSLGLAPQVVAEVFQIVSRLKETGIAILVAEQNAKVALNVAQRGMVLETGRVTLAGTNEKLLSNKEVQEAYLGR